MNDSSSFNTSLGTGMRRSDPTPSRSSCSTEPVPYALWATPSQRDIIASLPYTGVDLDIHILYILEGDGYRMGTGNIDGNSCGIS